MNTTYTPALSLRNRLVANCDRMKEMADTCQTENRMRNEAEESEFRSLTMDNQMIQMQISAMAANSVRGSAETMLEAANRQFRENMRKGEKSTFVFTRDLVTTTTVEPGGIIPISLMDILEPLQEGLILDKVGIKIMSGLAGEYIWSYYQPIEATILDEGVEVQDSDITLSKLTAKPERIAIAIPLTREAINQTTGIIETIVRDEMPKAVTRLINKILFSTEKVANATELVGPFVDCQQTATISAEPTFKELNALKAQVLETGIEGNGLCWVMTKATKANLEATPKDAGSGIMVCENDTICGLPVYTTNYIGENNIGLGDWSYQAMGLFGELSFIVDPYTKARSNAVDFVLNVNYGTKTLRPEAFLLATMEE